jgi:hypothetical protein
MVRLEGVPGLLLQDRLELLHSLLAALKQLCHLARLPITMLGVATSIRVFVGGL